MNIWNYFRMQPACQLRHFNYKGKRAHGRIYAAAYFVACIYCISTGIARPRASLAPLRPVTFVNSEREDRDHDCVVYLGDVQKQLQKQCKNNYVACNNFQFRRFARFNIKNVNVFPLPFLSLIFYYYDKDVNHILIKCNHCFLI